MRDLDIWRRLESGAATPADLAALAALPLGRRCAYVGAGLRLVTHADPRIRTAALGVLAGSRGFEGVRALVAALDDDDESVRSAALDALRETARDAPTRFAHALFHRRPDVRRAALATELADPIAERPSPAT
jgi:HEAT repeat protein